MGLINVVYLREWLDAAIRVAPLCTNAEQFQFLIDEQMTKLYGPGYERIEYEYRSK